MAEGKPLTATERGSVWFIAALTVGALLGALRGGTPGTVAGFTLVMVTAALVFVVNIPMSLSRGIRDAGGTPSYWWGHTLTALVLLVLWSWPVALVLTALALLAHWLLHRPWWSYVPALLRWLVRLPWGRWIVTACRWGLTRFLR